MHLLIGILIVVLIVKALSNNTPARCAHRCPTCGREN